MSRLIMRSKFAALRPDSMAPRPAPETTSCFAASVVSPCPGVPLLSGVSPCPKLEPPSGVNPSLKLVLRVVSLLASGIRVTGGLHQDRGRPGSVPQASAAHSPWPPARSRVAVARLLPPACSAVLAEPEGLTRNPLLTGVSPCPKLEPPSGVTPSRKLVLRVAGRRESQSESLSGSGGRRPRRSTNHGSHDSIQPGHEPLPTPTTLTRSVQPYIVLPDGANETITLNRN